MKHEDEPTDLLSEARRRPLSRDEEAELEELVGSSPEARILHYAGWAFDRDSSAREGDDVLVAKLAARAAERAEKPSVSLVVRRRKRPFVTLLAAALVVAGTAGAGVGVVYFVRAPERGAELSPTSHAGLAPAAKSKAHGARATSVALPAPAPESAPTPESAPAPVVAPLGPAPAVEPAPGREPTHSSAAAPASPAAPASRPKSASVSSGDALSAPALFGQANQLRLAGDTRGAITVYKLLTEHHPGSAEADLAELSLGKLLLATGDASQALTHFRRAAAAGGALGSEALWGEAGALKALGRTNEERGALERLLEQYPDGAYAKAARKRLGIDAP